MFLTEWNSINTAQSAESMYYIEKKDSRLYIKSRYP